MRIHRRLGSTLVGLTVIASILASCGASNSAIAGKTPSQQITQAITKLYSQSFTFTATVALKFDLSKVQGYTPAQLGAFGPYVSNGVSIGIDGSIESQNRAVFHLKLQPICSGDLYAAVYDGTSYISTDGSTWQSTGSASTTVSKPPDSTSTTKTLDGIGFVDKGSTTQDGQTVEDLRLDFNNGLIDKIAASSGQASSASSIKQFVNVTGDGEDVYIRPQDGLVESVKGTLNISLDVTQLVGLLSLASPGALSALGGATPSGKMGISLGEGLQFSNYGSTKVTKPAGGGTVTNPCSNLTSLLGGLGSLGSTSGSGGTSGDTPTPDSGQVNNVFSNVSNGLSGDTPTP